MPQFGSASLKHREDLDLDLKRIMDFVVAHWDCQILDGVRTLAEQEKNVAKGVSKTMASKHLPNINGKSEAVDVMPYPFDWAAIEKGLNAVKKADGGMQVCEVYSFIGFVQGVAAAMQIPLRSGGDWDSDRQFEDHTFIDLPHHELVRK